MWIRSFWSGCSIRALDTHYAVWVYQTAIFSQWLTYAPKRCGWFHQTHRWISYVPQKLWCLVHICRESCTRREAHSIYHAKLSNARKSTESCVLSRAPQSRKCSSRLDRLQSSIVPWSDLSVAQFYLFSVPLLNNCSARQNLWPPATGKPSFPQSHIAKCRWPARFSTKYCPSSSSCFRRNILALPLQCGGLPLRRSLILTMCRNSGRKLWYEVVHPSPDIL